MMMRSAMYRALKIGMLFGAAAALAAMVGCAGKRISAPAAAPTPLNYYQKASLAMSDFSVALLDAQGITVSLHTSGLIDAGTNTAIETTLREIAIDGKGVDSLISANAAPLVVANRIADTASALDAIVRSGAAGIKDKTSQDKFVNAINAIKTALDVVAVYFNPNAEVIHGSDSSRSPGRAVGGLRPSDVPAGNAGPAGRPGEVGRAAARTGRRELPEGDRSVDGPARLGLSLG